MKVKQKVKILIDICMTILLFVLMAFHYVGLQWHEVTGTVMLVLFILHHILNASWYRALGKGTYQSGRIFLTIVDVLLLFDMFLLMFSGIVMSRYVFPILSLPVSKAWARGIHLTASYNGFLLIGLHIGLHYGMIMGMVKRAFSIISKRESGAKKNVACIWLLRTMAILIAAYGIYALYTRKFMDYISQRVMFVYFDYDEPVIFFIIDYAAIMGLMVLLSYYLQHFLHRKVSSDNDKIRRRRSDMK